MWTFKMESVGKLLAGYTCNFHQLFFSENLIDIQGIISYWWCLQKVNEKKRRKICEFRVYWLASIQVPSGIFFNILIIYRIYESHTEWCPIRTTELANNDIPYMNMITITRKCWLIIQVIVSMYQMYVFLKLDIMITSPNVAFSALLVICNGDRWIPLTKSNDDVELWYFLWYAPEQTVNGWVNNRDADDMRHHALIMTSL